MCRQGRDGCAAGGRGARDACPRVFWGWRRVRGSTRAVLGASCLWARTRRVRGQQGLGPDVLNPELLCMHEGKAKRFWGHSSPAGPLHLRPLPPMATPSGPAWPSKPTPSTPHPTPPHPRGEGRDSGVGGQPPGPPLLRGSPGAPPALGGAFYRFHPSAPLPRRARILPGLVASAPRPCAAVPLGRPAPQSFTIRNPPPFYHTPQFHPEFKSRPGRASPPLARRCRRCTHTGAPKSRALTRP